MNSLWIMRHGNALDDNASDALRSLSERGWRQSRAQAQRMNALGVQFDCVWVSPLERAQQTFEAFSQEYAFPLDRVISSDLIKPSADVNTLIAAIEKSAAEQLLIISHQPLVSSLVAMLVSGRAGDRALPVMSTGALIHLQADMWRASWAQLVQHYPAIE